MSGIHIKKGEKIKKVANANTLGGKRISFPTHPKVWKVEEDEALRAAVECVT